jgi:hypothetical protein
MRLEKYINEAETNWDKVIKDCQPFLKKYGNLYKKRQYVWRGSKKNVREILKVTAREDRRSSDVPKILHDRLDELFKKKFGWNVRSEGVFCTGDKHIAEYYGNARIFLPIGKFKFVWSPEVYDMWEKLRHANLASGWTGPGEPKQVHYDPRDDADEMTLNKIVDSYMDKNLERAIRSKNEIAFNSKSYYLVRDVEIGNIIV